MQANYVIEDLSKLSPDKFGFSEEEFNNLKAQCRVLRAWFYIRLLDAFRNVPLAVSYNDVSLMPARPLPCAKTETVAAMASVAERIDFLLVKAFLMFLFIKCSCFVPSKEWMVLCRAVDT
jgi:hypothetical protein